MTHIESSTSEVAVPSRVAVLSSCLSGCDPGSRGWAQSQDGALESGGPWQSDAGQVFHRCTRQDSDVIAHGGLVTINLRTGAHGVGKVGEVPVVRTAGGREGHLCWSLVWELQPNRSLTLVSDSGP
jgi:hypothetical protein